MLKRKCKITFIRHGATIYTDGNILSDNTQFPTLNELGKEEMERMATWVLQRGLKVDKIFTSECKADIQSAAYISKVLNQQYEILPNLHPRKAGIWDGLSFDQIMEKYPEDFQNYREHKADFAPEGGESVGQVNKRVKGVIESIIKDNISKRIIIITNRDVIQSAVKLALDIDEQSQTNVNLNTASATQISYFKEFSMLMYANYIPFL